MAARAPAAVSAEVRAARAQVAAPSPAVNACPAGSTFNPVDQFCEIVLPGGGTIIISRPFQGPTGGTVVALSVARKRFHSVCLFGAGPQYAIVGTNGPDRINGTVRGERILGLGGNDRIVFGGSGSDRIYAPNERDYVNCGSGRDVAFVNVFAARYAHRHGCEKTGRIRPHQL